MSLLGRAPSPSLIQVVPLSIGSFYCGVMYGTITASIIIIPLCALHPEEVGSQDYWWTILLECNCFPNTIKDLIIIPQKLASIRHHSNLIEASYEVEQVSIEWHDTWSLFKSLVPYNNYSWIEWTLSCNGHYNIIVFTNAVNWIIWLWKHFQVPGFLSWHGKSMRNIVHSTANKIY